MRKKILTQEDIVGLREAIQSGYRAFSGIVVYKGIAFDHRPAHIILEALEAGEPEIVVKYEEWQRVEED